MPLEPGDTVHDFTFLRADGSPVSLASTRGRPLLLVFLRHLA
jgi:peroxiredoxin